MTNSANMTLEEKLVQRLKNLELFQLVDDEDAILELTTRAVREATIQPRRELDHFGRVRETDSPVLVAARAHAEKVMEKIADKAMEDLFADPKAKKLLYEAMISLIPQVLMSRLDDGLAKLIQGESARQIQELRDYLRGGGPM